MEFDVIPVLLFPWFNKPLIRNVLVLFWMFDSILRNALVIYTKSYIRKIYIASFALQIVNLSVPFTCDFYFLFLINFCPSLLFYPLRWGRGIYSWMFLLISFFLSRFSFTTIHESQNCRGSGRGGGGGGEGYSFNSSPLLPPAS